MSKIFPQTTRSAFAASLMIGTLIACAPNPNGMGVADYGMVTGTVVDYQNPQLGISGATVAIGNVVAVTSQADNGGFILRNVPVGTQTVRISAIGWQSASVTVTVTKDAETSIGPIGLVTTLNR